MRIGDTLYVAGTSAITHQTGPIWERPLAADFETQARQTFENVRRVMEDAGGTLADIYKITMLLQGQKVLRRDQPDPRGVLPPDKAYISTGFITELVRDDMLIEIDAEAHLGA